MIGDVRLVSGYPIRPIEVDYYEGHLEISMQLNDYFEFITPLDIRIKGHRIGIDDVLTYHFQGLTPQQIAERLPTLSMEKIDACLTYYERNKPAMDEYMSKLAAQRERRFQEAEANPPEVVRRLRALHPLQRQ